MSKETCFHGKIDLPFLLQNRPNKGNAPQVERGTRYAQSDDVSALSDKRDLFLWQNRPTNALAYLQAERNMRKAMTCPLSLTLGLLLSGMRVH